MILLIEFEPLARKHHALETAGETLQAARIAAGHRMDQRFAGQRPGAGAVQDDVGQPEGPRGRALGVDRVPDRGALGVTMREARFGLDREVRNARSRDARVRAQRGDFIASSTQSAPPAAIVSPGLTCTLATLPFIGASSRPSVAPRAVRSGGSMETSCQVRDTPSRRKCSVQPSRT